MVGGLPFERRRIPGIRVRLGTTYQAPDHVDKEQNLRRGNEQGGHGDGGIHPETEALLMFAARREHIENVIAPAIARGDTILCDRFSDASFAYQGGGSGVEWEKLAALEDGVHPDIQPDLTLYFDLPVEIARQRINQPDRADRFEQEDVDYFVRVRTAYLARAKEFPERIRIIDAARSPEEINEELEEVIGTMCL